MKMTLPIDEVLFSRVMQVAGAKSKTKAINPALRKMDRKAKLVSLRYKGFGLDPDELRDAIAPNYNLDRLRNSESSSTNGRTRRAR